MFVICEVYMQFNLGKCSLFSNHQVLSTDNGDALGDEIIFLTDGEATDDIDSCSRDAIKTGAIIHTIALGPNAASALTEMAKETGK